MPPTLLLIGVLMVPPPTVVVPLDALAPPEADPFEPPVEVIVDAVAVDLDLGDETAVDVTWTLHTLQPTWVDLPVSGADLALDDATLDGLPVALPASADGIRRLTARLDGDHVLRVTGTVFTPQRRMELPVLPASRGMVQAGGDWDVEVADAVTSRGATWDLLGVDRLAVTWKPATPPAPRPIVVTSESATAVRLGAGGLEGTTTLRYLIRHGTVEALSFDLSGPTDHLAVEGTGVREFTQVGTRVDVALSRPTRGHVTLTVSYRAPPPDGDDATAIPIPVPPDSQGSWITVLQADQSLVAPDPRAHLEAVATRHLPVWARGLSDGTQVVAYRVTGRSPALDYRLLVFDPVEEPPTLVDEARYEVAYTAHGRVLMRARYQVRNDRNQYLRVTTPPGFTAMGVRVAGDVVQPVAVGGVDLLVPLEKSVETLHGLVTFPVEIFFWGQEEAWERRGVRTLTTPAVDAPVAYARWEIIMPPGVEARQTEGIPTLVPSWTAKQGGLAYGQSYGDALEPETLVVADGAPARRRKQRVVRSPAPIFGMKKPAEPGMVMAEPPPPPPEVEQAFLEDASQEAWNMAYRAYQDNDFDEAAGWLDESLILNPDNSAASALMANVDVLLGSDKGGDAQDSSGEEVMERRIRDMARARTQGEAVKQEKAKKKAEQSLRAGDLESARAELESLVEITRELALVEQAEAFDQKSQLAEYSRQLEEIDELEGRRRSREDRGKSTSWKTTLETKPDVAVMSDHEAPSYDSRTVIDFEEVTIAGELDRWEADGDGRDLGRFEDEDGLPDLSALMALGYMEGPVDLSEDGEYDLPAGSFAVELVPGDGLNGLLGGGGGDFTLGGATTSSTELEVFEVAEVPEITEEEDEERPGKDRGPVTTARLTEVVTLPELGVVASQLTLQIPRAGQSLRLEQRLIPENTPLTLEVGFRPDRRSP